MRAALALALCLAAGLVQAQTLRPMPKPAAFAAAQVKVASLRPAPNPFRGKAAPLAAAKVALTVPRPMPKPADLLTLVSAPEAPKAGRKRASMKGAVCGRPEIKGEALPPMRSTVKGCGIAEPVSITEIAGVRLSPAPTINCDLASAISDWVQEDLQPAFRGQVTGLNVAASYVCRPRNNIRGNPPSVHGKGEAIDFSAVILGNKAVEVSSRLDRRWQKARKAGCDNFTVILGPGSDGHHETHIHMDVSRHGGSPHCR